MLPTDVDTVAQPFYSLYFIKNKFNIFEKKKKEAIWYLFFQSYFTPPPLMLFVRELVNIFL